MCFRPSPKAPSCRLRSRSFVAARTRFPPTVTVARPSSPSAVLQQSPGDLAAAGALPYPPWRAPCCPGNTGNTAAPVAGSAPVPAQPSAWTRVSELRAAPAGVLAPPAVWRVRAHQDRSEAWGPRPSAAVGCFPRGRETGLYGEALGRNPGDQR